MNYENQIKNKGLKITPQRIAVLKYLDEHRTHPTAENIYEDLKINNAGLSLATVYNTLNKFWEVGLIKGFSGNKNKKNFDKNTEHHSHFICKNCSRIYDIFNDQKIELSQTGHEMESYDLIIYGKCKDCLIQTKKEK